MPGSESIDISSSIDTILLRSPSSIGDNDSMPSTPCTRTSSDESHTIPTPPRVAPTPIITNKHGRDSNAPPPPQTWLAWLSEQFTTQYTFPPAYAQGVLQVSNTVFPLGILFGLCLPTTVSFLWNSLFLNPSVAFFKLGNPSTTDEWKPWYSMPQLHIYLLAWTVFHMLEFNVTASYNPTRLYSDSFLLNNGKHYHYAHLFSLFEFCLTSHFYPRTKSAGLSTYLGLGLMLFGQIFRSLAMIQASNNFSHILAWKKRNDHELVKHGVYGWVRHPSYVGFTYWALGTQVMLGNKVGLVGRRIRAEERALIEFFGDEYREYKQKVGTGLPFIK
ncbi:related to STE14 - farnesyl cysteine carboxyl-methyltransferase [Melanopsichium pennsylvanicum]|uniref:Protein-S-isoprenylcysteine O-methyltransferase n=1 Tax=Melanopsichium pennsylvanicum TaxID=63383 RepID=A0AAJ5C493_9BASI|nr:related to STE14 - farnesyl cysteine carboxyl-methyltransferase [Melanopsichium pennsylvanicum]